MNLPEMSAHFPSTSWSRVANATSPDAPEARAALAGLCESYWYPLYALIRREGHDEHAALDLTQAYFARLLEKGTLAAADRDKGRLRTFLRVDCEHFLVDQHRRRQAIAKGGRRTIVSIDARDAEGRFQHEPADTLTPERIFDQTWALNLLDRALEILAGKYAAAGKADVFEHFKAVLTEGPGASPGAEVAARLGMADRNALYQATHRFKARYRKILRDQIAATLADPAEVDEELRFLFEAIRP